MPVKAYMGALVGAVIGALVWGLIAWVANYEVGYVAWGIGALVGWLGSMLGGRGISSGVICGLMALFAIFAGKVFAVYCMVKSQDVFKQTDVRKNLDKVFTREAYQAEMAKANAFAAVKSEAEYPAFMATHGYSESDSPQQVTADDVTVFKQEFIPRLRTLHAEKPSYETWREGCEKEIAKGLTTDLGAIVSAVTHNLEFVDILFAILGLATAFQLGKGSAEAAPAATPTPTP